MSVLLSDFNYFIEKKFHLSIRVWIFILSRAKFLLRDQILGAKSAKKKLPCRYLETLHLWSLAIGVKAQRLTSRSPPIKLLNFLHLLIDQRSVKTS